MELETFKKILGWPSAQNIARKLSFDGIQSSDGRFKVRVGNSFDSTAIVKVPMEMN